tara:strand:+ start:4233 stop:4463 length:231 start_codon:yes stop_codon:yes gene_type:complete
MDKLTDDQKKLRETVLQAVATLTQQYGEDAEVVATLRAAEFAAQGDVEALQAWDLIIEYLVALREGKPEAVGDALN